MLHAIHPLFSLHSDLLDSTVLVLRKSMFNREVAARLVGLIGSVELLKAFRSSQAPAAAAEAGASSGKERLRLELLGFMRRCLTQQPEVREELYRSLPDVLRGNPGLHEAVFGMLAAQLRLYFDPQPSPDRAPLFLNKCLERTAECVLLLEPLPQLLYCIVQCLEIHRKKHAAVPAEAGAAATQLYKDMGALAEQILKSELEDFELDKSSDYSDSLVVCRSVSLSLCMHLPLLSLHRHCRVSTIEARRTCCWACTKC